MNTFLTISEIKELTGYTQKRRQCSHLDDLGIPYHKDHFGNPKVYRAQYEAIKPIKHNTPAPMIDLEAMKQVING